MIRADHPDVLRYGSIHVPDWAPVPTHCPILALLIVVGGAFMALVSAL